MTTTFDPSQCNDRLNGKCDFSQNRCKAHMMHHIRNGVPTTISRDEVHLLPKREDFVHPTLSAAFARQVEAGQPFLFRPNSVHDKIDWVNGRARYRIYLYGILPCGSKACVILDNIVVHADVLVPEGVSADDFDRLLRERLFEKKINFEGIDDVQMYRPKEFNEKMFAYKRVRFSVLSDRKRFLNMVSAHNSALGAGQVKWETAADDLGKDNYYFQKVAREMRFNTTDWNRVAVYETLEAPHMDRRVSANCKYTFLVDVNEFKRLSKARRADLCKNKMMRDALDRDLTMVGMWDIETYRELQNGEVPTPADTDYVIFMVCTAYFWHYSTTALLTVCCVDQAANARDGVLVTIVCGTEENVLLSHYDVMGQLAPDLQGAFNGGNFDAPLVRETLRRLGRLRYVKQRLSSMLGGRREDTEEDVLRWCFKSECIKLDATSKHALKCVYNFPGMLDFDVLPTFMQLYTKMEVRKAASLNFFLAKNGLDSKEDMPYKRMFRIYERAIKMAAIRRCHCWTGTTAFENSQQYHCGCCGEIVPAVDCVPTVVDGETVYTDELLPELLHKSGEPNAVPANIGKQKCCFCGKKQRNLADMAHVGYYCVIDCVRPQELCVKRMIIPDRRQLSNTTYVSLYDSFYRAKGMKVRNYVGACCHKFNIAFSNANVHVDDSEKVHYPGAWVFQPIKGLNNRRPVTGLDFQSLYPSLMMTYNLSSDMVVTDSALAQKLMELGYVLHRIEPFEYEIGEKKGAALNRRAVASGWTVRHNGIFNPKRDKHIIVRYDKHITYTWDDQRVECIGEPSEADKQRIAAAKASGTAVTKTAKYVPVYGRERLPGERMGVLPMAAKKIFDKRVPVKKEYVRMSKLKERMEKEHIEEIEVDGVTMTLADVRFKVAMLDSLSKALKEVNNTFYGESGNMRSSIYSLPVAGGITCAGQYNIKLIAAYVEGRGFKVQYGDTDSLYLICPDEVYTACDAKYRTAVEAINADTSIDVEQRKKKLLQAKIDYWTEMVQITMTVMDQLKEDVADYLVKDNGFLFLNMAYEEVGFPFALFGKKKYAMTPHIETVNFYPKDLFIRGIDIVKQGQAPIIKKLGEEVLREALSPENELELIDIVKAKMHKYFDTKWEPAMFARYAKYNTEKKNASVHLFVARMKAIYAKYKKIAETATEPDVRDAALAQMALYEPPEPGDKFQYVIVKKNVQHTLQGNMINLKKGDYMEYMRVYKASQTGPEPMEIDMLHYMESGLIGLFSRYISYHEMFKPTREYNLQDNKEYKMMDHDIIKRASAYLTNYMNEILGRDPRQAARQGCEYRAAYRQARTTARDDMARRYGVAAYLVHEISLADDGTADGTTKTSRLMKQIEDLATADAQGAAYGYGARFIQSMKKRGHFDLFRFRRIYNGDKGLSIAKLRLNLCNTQKDRIMDELYALSGQLVHIIDKYEKGFVNVVFDMRRVHDIGEAGIGVINDLPDGDVQALKQALSLFTRLAAVLTIRARTLDVINEIELLKNSAVDSIVLSAADLARRDVLQQK